MVKKLKNGELTTPEIRKLIRAHNVLVSIKIPKGSKREDIIKIIDKAGYKIDHDNGKLLPVSKGKVKKMKVIDQKKVQEVLPKPKTDAQKKEAKKKREQKKQAQETAAYEKRRKQVEAIEKVKARRKKGEIKKPKENIYPTFDSIKKLEKYFIEQINKFMKTEGMRFVNKIKSPKMTEKEIKDGRRDLRKLYQKRVLDILEANDDLFADMEDGDEKYEELEEIYDKRFEPISSKVVERIKELRKNK
tara:strand:+ start:131 stop:868 length:738 start_codon:yes stop_codon:yes gene_type:complete